jgi:hypothetical protein
LEHWSFDTCNTLQVVEYLERNSAYRETIVHSLHTFLSKIAITLFFPNLETEQERKITSSKTEQKQSNPEQNTTLTS